MKILDKKPSKYFSVEILLSLFLLLLVLDLKSQAYYDYDVRCLGREMDGSLTDLLLVSQATIVRTKHQGVFEETSVSTDISELRLKDLDNDVLNTQNYLEELDKQLSTLQDLIKIQKDKIKRLKDLKKYLEGLP